MRWHRPAGGPREVDGEGDQDAPEAHGAEAAPAARKASEACGRQLAALAPHLADGALLEAYCALAGRRETRGNLAVVEGVVGHLDRDALVLAGLNAALPWQVKFDVTCGTTVYAEALEVVELPRFAIDSTESFGEFPQNYRPRGVIDGASNAAVSMARSDSRRLAVTPRKRSSMAAGGMPRIDAIQTSLSRPMSLRMWAASPR